MRSEWEIMWTFETANFSVEWAITPDYDLDLSWDEDGEVRAKLESGEYQSFGSRVTVTHKATGEIIGEDSLWGSIYADPREFRDHIGARGRWGSYIRDLVSGACSEARKRVQALHAIQLREPA